MKIPNFNPFKTTYRVFEIKKGNNTSKFYPQTRHAFVIWKPVLNRHDKPEWFTTLEESNKFLYELTRQARAKTVVGTESHEFNEVFHKLSSRDSGGDVNEDTDCDSCQG